MIVWAFRKKDKQTTPCKKTQEAKHRNSPKQENPPSRFAIVQYETSCKNATGRNASGSVFRQSICRSHTRSSLFLDAHTLVPPTHSVSRRSIWETYWFWTMFKRLSILYVSKSTSHPRTILFLPLCFPSFRVVRESISRNKRHPKTRDKVLFYWTTILICQCLRHGLRV